MFLPFLLFLQHRGRRRVWVAGGQGGARWMPRARREHCDGAMKEGKAKRPNFHSPQSVEKIKTRLLLLCALWLFLPLSFFARSPPCRIDCATAAQSKEGVRLHRTCAEEQWGTEMKRGRVGLCTQRALRHEKKRSKAGGIWHAGRVGGRQDRGRRKRKRKREREREMGKGDGGSRSLSLSLSPSLCTFSQVASTAQLSPDAERTRERRGEEERGYLRWRVRSSHRTTRPAESARQSPPRRT